jgi:hypothetical protein
VMFAGQFPNRFEPSLSSTDKPATFIPFTVKVYGITGLPELRSVTVIGLADTIARVRKKLRRNLIFIVSKQSLIRSTKTRTIRLFSVVLSLDGRREEVDWLQWRKR